MENKNEFAKMFDHTILKADATNHQVMQLCREALENGFASVCVNSCYTALAAEQLKNSWRHHGCKGIGWYQGLRDCCCNDKSGSKQTWNQCDRGNCEWII